MRALLAVFGLSLSFGLTACRTAAPPVATSTAGPPPTEFNAPVLAALHGALLSGPEATFVLDSARSAAAIGDAYHEVGLSATLLRTFAGAVQVTSIERYPDQTLAIGIRVRHPFPLATRPDLHAFNLKAHLQTPVTMTIDGLACDPGRLRNADGYSTLWAAQATGDAIDLMPYRILSRQPTAGTFDPAAPAGWNVFAAGSTHDAMLELSLPDTTTALPVSIYLTADFGQSATFETRQTPAYSLPQFAGKAPWRVQLTTTRNDLASGVLDSSADFRLEIWHWAQGAGLDRDVRTPVTISFPDIAPEQSIASLVGTGTEPTPLTANVTLANEYGVAEGLYYGFVRVETESEGGNALLDDLATPLPVDTYYTWQVMAVLVGAAPPVGDPPVPVIARPCATQQVGVGRPVVLDATGTTDTEDPVGDLTFEWCSDYNGFKFLPDAFGQVTSVTYESSGVRTIALAVTDTNFNRVQIERTIEVVDGWVGHRELVRTTGVNDVLHESRQLSDGMLFSPAGIPMVMTRDPDDTGAVNLFHYGSGCPPLATPFFFQTDTLPDITVYEETAFFAWSPYTTEIRVAAVDLTALELENEVVVMDAQQLLADSIPRDRAIIVDPGTGNLLLVAELRYTGDGQSQLWAAEKNPSGDWSEPFYLTERANGTDQNPPDLALGMTLGSVMLLWADTVPGPPDFAQRRTMSALYSFGVQAIDDPVDTELPLGTVSDYLLRSDPDGGLVGVYTDVLQPQPQLLRYDAGELAWSATAIGSLTTPQRDARIAIDEAGITTVAWVDTPVAGSHRLLTKRFSYNALPGEIGDGEFELVRAATTTFFGQPQIGAIFATGELAIAWLERIDGERQVWGATY